MHRGTLQDLRYTRVFRGEHAGLSLRACVWGGVERVRGGGIYPSETAGIHVFREASAVWRTPGVRVVAHVWPELRMSACCH